MILFVVLLLGMYVPVTTEVIWWYWTYYKRHRQVEFRVGQYTFVLWRDYTYNVVYWHFQVYRLSGWNK